jgi:hypothetical protein
MQPTPTKQLQQMQEPTKEEIFSKAIMEQLGSIQSDK